MPAVALQSRWKISEHMICHVAHVCALSASRVVPRMVQEGLASLPGFVALALMGDAVGGILQDAVSSRGLFQLVSLDFVLWVSAMAAEILVERPSRRLCNAAFVLWTSAQALNSFYHLYTAHIIVPGSLHS